MSTELPSMLPARRATCTLTASVAACARLVAFAAITAAFVLASAALAAPTVSNVRAAQRPGTNLVDLYYDLAGAESEGASVSVELSGDGGASYGLPVSALSGDVGAGVRNALNLRIVWDAGTDRPNISSATMRLRLTASVTPSAGFAFIPAGNFSMGDSFAEGSGDELPVHTVTLSAFYIAKTETTKAQWDDVRTWGLNNGYTDLYAGSGKTTIHPVQTVSWNDIVKWCNAASQRDNLEPVYRTSTGGIYKTGTITPVINYANNGYRLPSEAEWEKAARGGLIGQRFPWGAKITHYESNYYSYTDFSYDVSATRGFHPSYNNGGMPYTAPVGSFSANGYGLFDVTGNVWEWCGDFYDSGYYSNSSGSDPRGPVTGDYRVVRGGGWGNYLFFWRVSDRDRNPPESRYYDGGFRLARSL